MEHAAHSSCCGNAPDHSHALPTTWWQRWGRVSAAVTLALSAELVHWWGEWSWLPWWLAAAAIILVGPEVYKKGWVALRQAQFTINALMSLAVTGALLIGQWPEAAMVLALFNLAERIEAQSLLRAHAAVDRLYALVPDQVHVWEPISQHWVTKAASQVTLGQIVRLSPGERVGLDGVVVKGMSELNQAPITGESMPVAKQVGDRIYAGSINGDSELQVRVDTLHDQTLVARIALSVQQAQQNKLPLQRMMDHFAAVYTPIVMVLAVAVAMVLPWFGVSVWEAVYRALVLLVIACPCALVISTPVAVVSALTAAAHEGVLIKGGAYLEQLRHTKQLMLDKTGTLTTGQPVLHGYWLNPAVDTEHSVRLAQSLAHRSTHPASRAVVSAALSALENYELEHFLAQAGKGVQATYQGQTYYLGSPQWLTAEQTLYSPEALEWMAVQAAQGASLVVLADAQQCLGVFALQDGLKPEAQQAVQRLQALGVRVHIASGDQSAAVAQVAQQLRVDSYQGELLPQDKLNWLQALQRSGSVVMAGDGINDAPALAQAQVGIAMGRLGSDLAIDTANITILNDSLQQLPNLWRLSTRLHHVLMQNITAALCIKLVFLSFAVLGDVPMWLAVFADVGASLLVILNSLRLLRTPSLDVHPA